MGYVKRITCVLLLIFIMYVFAPNPSMVVHAENVSSGEGLLEIVARMMDDFDMLFELHEMLEVLSVEERNSIGSTMMASMQSIQAVSQQVQALSEGRLFLIEAMQRYEFNRTVSAGNESIGLSGFIHGQRNPPQSNLQVGPAGNGGDHGCGPISAHNMLYSLYTAGIIIEAPCIAEIIHRLDMSGGFIMSGEFGTNPEAIIQLLQNMGHYTIINYLPTDLDAAIRQSAAQTAILLYIGQAAPGRPAYWHYITVRYVDDRFELYNVGSRDMIRRTTNSVDEWARSRAVLALITIDF